MASFKPNPEFDKQLFATAEIRELVDNTGEKVLAKAEDNAMQHSDSGTFAASFTGKSTTSGSGRPRYVVESDDPAALSKEFGTSKTTAIRALGRAVRGVKQ